MTLEEFAKDAGVEVFECEPGWGGKWGYKELNYRNVTVCGCKTKTACYKDWLACKFGERTAAAIIKLLRRTK